MNINKIFKRVFTLEKYISDNKNNYSVLGQSLELLKGFEQVLKKLDVEEDLEIDSKTKCIDYSLIERIKAEGTFNLPDHYSGEYDCIKKFINGDPIDQEQEGQLLQFYATAVVFAIQKCKALEKQLRARTSSSLKESVNFFLEEKKENDILFYNTIARKQRGSHNDGAEETMRKIGLLVAGVICTVTEHGGDLLYTLTHDPYKDIYSWSWARTRMITKCEYILRTLKNPYGFEKEFQENISECAQTRKIPENELRSKLYELLKKYAEEHSKLPVYNKIQYIAREVAISIGERNWEKAISMAEETIRLAEDSKEWYKIAGSIDPKYSKTSIKKSLLKL